MLTRICVAVLVLGGLSGAQFAGPPGHVVGGESHAFPGHRSPGPHAWWKSPDVVQSVGLSEAQVQKLDQLALDHRMKMIDLRAGLEREQVRFESLIRAASPDENQILNQIDKVSAQRSQIEKANVQLRLATRRVLTPEQWKKFTTSRGFGGPMHREFAPEHGSFDGDHRGGEPRHQGRPQAEHEGTTAGPPEHDDREL